MLLFGACTPDYDADITALEEKILALEESSVLQVPEVGEFNHVPQGDFFLTFDKDRYVVDAASSVTIGYSLQEDSSVEVIAKEGWQASVVPQGNTGTVTITAPDPAGYSEVTVIATSKTGRSTAAVVPLLVRDPYTAQTRPIIDALGYYSFKPLNANLENYQKLADAGITIVTVETDEEDYLQQMDMARQVGIKVLAVIGWATGGWYDNMSDESLRKLENLIGTLKDHPALYGYHICDEPSVDKIYELMAIEDKMTRLDPDHPIYVNLHPNSSSGSLGVSTYYDYVEAYASMMHLRQLSFDIYPILEGGIQGDWHMCLGIVSDAARRYGIPFWAFAASCWINLEATLLHRAKPTVENILLQSYTNLAYGAQAVQYFTIQDYSGTDFAPIMRDGTWTEAYDYLKEAVLQMQKRSFVFKGGNVKKIRQAGVVSLYDSALSIQDMPEEIEKIEVAGSATVSFIENRGNEYVVIVNNYCNWDQPMGIHLKSPAYMIDTEGEFHLYEPGGWAFDIPSGGMMVFKYR